MATPTAVTGFTLLDADTGKVLKELASGAVLNLSALPKNVAIRANTSPATVGSVRFALSGAQAQSLTESTAPYALFGDTNGNYNGWQPKPGAYTLTATPYQYAGAAGTAGKAVTIGFSVIAEAIAAPVAAPAPPVVAKPVPAPPAGPAPTPALLSNQNGAIQLQLDPGYPPTFLEMATTPDVYAPLLPQAASATYDPDTRIFSFVVAPGAVADVRYAAGGGKPASPAVRVSGPALTEGGGLFIFGSPEAEQLPGDEFTLTVNPGQFQVILEAPGKAPIVLKPVSQGPTTRTLRIPTSYVLAEYKVYLRAGKNVSAPIYLNRPRCKGYRSPFVLGGCPFEIHGPALLLDGGTPSLRFVAPNNQSYQATINLSKSHRYGINATSVLPDSLAGQNLTVYYSNGLPGATEVAFATPVQVVARTLDPLGIGEAWAHRYDWTNRVDATVGTSNDRPAILAAAQQTKAKNPLSGVVRMVGSNIIKMRWTPGTGAALFETDANVLFYSEDPTAKVQYNFTGDAMSGAPALFYWGGTGRIGMANLTFEDQNISNGNFKTIQNFAKDIDGFIAHNVTLKSGGTEAFTFNLRSFQHVHFTNCTITNPWNNVDKRFGPVTISKFSYFSFTNGVTSHALGQLAFRDGTNLWLAGNSIELDASAQAAVSAFYAGQAANGQKRHVSLDGIKGFYLWNNTYTTKGVPVSVTDLEGILVGEGWGGNQHTNGYAQPASVSGTTLTLQSTQFISKLSQYGVGAVVSIISGPGTGQRASIAAYDGNLSLVLTKGFAVSPTSASQLAFNNICVEDGTVGGSTFTDNGGSIVSLGYRCLDINILVADITALRSDGPQLEKGQRATSTFAQFTPSYGASFLRIAQTNGGQTRVASRLHIVTMNDAYQLPTAQGGGILRGTSVYNLEMKDNTIIPNTNLDFKYPVNTGPSGYAQFDNEGFLIAIKNNCANPTPTDVPTRATEGIVMQRNTGPLYLNEAATYAVMGDNNFSRVRSVAAGNQAGALASYTVTNNEVLTEATPFLL